MNYLHQDRSRQGGSNKAKVLALAALLFLVLIFRSPLMYAAVAVGSYIVKPIWITGNFIGLGGLAEKDRRDILSRRTSELEKQNKFLLETLSREAFRDYKYAFVLSSIRSSPYETIIIDQGSESGVGHDDIVISDNGVALGKVIEVYPKISKVELFSSPGKEIEVLLDGEQRVITTGEGSQNFFLKLPRGVEISSSSTIYLPGEGAMLLALVERVHDEPGDAFIKVYARSPLNIHRVTDVYVKPR